MRFEWRTSAFTCRKSAHETDRASVEARRPAYAGCATMRIGLPVVLAIAIGGVALAETHSLGTTALGVLSGAAAGSALAWLNKDPRA